MVESAAPPSPSQAYSALLRGTNLVLSVARLCLWCAQVHKGVVGDVASWMFTNKIYQEYLKSSVSGKAEVKVYTPFLIPLFNFEVRAFFSSCLH